MVVIITIIGLAMFTGMASAFVPALGASRMEPYEAIMKSEL